MPGRDDPLVLTISTNVSDLRSLQRETESARRLLRLVGELLDLSRLAAGRFELHVAEHDLAEQLRRELAAFEQQAHARGIDLAGEVLADPLLLWYDADQLERMLSNLLANALKFTPVGGQVRLRLVPTAQEVGIEVESGWERLQPSRYTATALRPRRHDSM